MTAAVDHPPIAPTTTGELPQAPAGPQPAPIDGAPGWRAVATVSATYPAGDAATSHTLSDGEPVLLRDVSPADEPLLLDLLEHVTGDSRWLRFFTGGADVRKAAAAEADCDGRSLGVLVLSADRATVLGHGMCVPATGGEAEIAFEVADGHHRRGIGGIMLARLVGRARDAGYTGLVAEVLPANRDMLDLLKSSGHELRSTTDGGVRSVRIALTPTTVEADR